MESILKLNFTNQNIQQNVVEYRKDRTKTWITFDCAVKQQLKSIENPTEKIHYF